MTPDEAALLAVLAPRYTVLSELGRGSTAVVYLADDHKHLRRVAIKILRADVARAVGPDRFLREIRIAAGLNHPGIVHVHDSGHVGGILFYVMSFVEGESLRARLNRQGPLPLPEMVRISTQIASALDHAHAQGIVHRDLKPENILLSEGHALIADFGVARVFAESGAEGLTEPGLAVGTPYYMSPEQAAADPRIDARSDVYSLGVVAYEMLTGEPPFQSASPRAVLARKLTDEIPPIRSVRERVPTAVEKVVTQALARVPGDRHASAGEFATALVGAAAGGSAEGSQSRRWLPRRSLGSVLLLLIGISVRHAPAVDIDAALVPEWVVISDVSGTAAAEIRSTVGTLLHGIVDQSGRLVSLPASQVAQGLESMLLPDTTGLTREIALEVAVRGGVGTVLVPELDMIGSSYVLTLRAVRSADDSLLVAVSIEAGADDSLLQAASDIVKKIAPQLSAGSQASLRKWPPPRTRSFAAFRSWAAGMRSLQQAQRDLALEFFAAAVRLDSTFATAWCWVAQEQSLAGLMNAADSSFARAFSDSSRLTEFDRLMCRTIQAAHQRNYQGAVLLTAKMVEQFGVNHSNHAVALAMAGRLDEAIEALEYAWQAYPFEPPDREVLAMVGWLIEEARHKEAADVLSSLPDTDAKLQWEARLALAAGEWERVDELTRGPIRHLPISPILRAELQAARGRIKEMIEEIQTAPPMHPLEVLTPDEHEMLLLVAVAADNGTFSPDLVSLDRESSDRARLLLGLWKVHAGDIEAAEAVLDATRQVSERQPQTARHYSDMCRRQVLRARLRLAKRDWDGVLTTLSRSLCREYDGNGRMYLLSEWTLAEALEQLGHLDSAAIRYAALTYGQAGSRSFYTPRGLTSSFAHRRAALLYSAVNENSHAIRHWQHFLSAFSVPDTMFLGWIESARLDMARLQSRGEY